MNRGSTQPFKLWGMDWDKLAPGPVKLKALESRKALKASVSRKEELGRLRPHLLRPCWMLQSPG